MTVARASSRAVAVALLAAATSSGAVGSAGAAGLSEGPPGASSCSGCHAVRSGGRSSVPPIAGRPAAEIEAALSAFRSGSRPATVMNRIATGFSADESRAVATWLTEQAPPR